MPVHMHACFNNARVHAGCVHACRVNRACMHACVHALTMHVHMQAVERCYEDAELHVEYAEFLMVSIMTSGYMHAVATCMHALLSCYVRNNMFVLFDYRSVCPSTSMSGRAR
jgi:hypothetical protein